MAIPFMLDEDVQLSLANGLRARGCDAIHVREVGRRGFPDREQLEYAITQQRCFMTFNVRDFVQLHDAWLNDQHEHCGIIVSPQRSVGDCLRRLLALSQTTNSDDIRNQLLFL
jgi:predicted nuclease of predicted toxin-antitoxin system